MRLRSRHRNQVKLRRWNVADAEFCCVARNDPALMRWFRQKTPLVVEDQKKFIEADLETNAYGGYVIETEGIPVGLCAIKSTGEFSIGILPEYQHNGIATKAMKLLLKKCPHMWSEVFVGNPALEYYISVFGFKITGVKEKAYHKEGVGFVDVVEIKHDPEFHHK